MRKNLLFIHTFWLFVAAFLSTFVYVVLNKVGGVYLYQHTKMFIKTFWPLVLGAIISLIFAIPLGVCPKKKSAKIECAVLEGLIIIACFATIGVLNANGNIPHVSNVFEKVYYFFMATGLITYLSILSVVCILKVMFTIIFRNDESSPKYASKIALNLTPALFVGGLLGLLFSAVLKIKKGSIASLKDYVRLVDKNVLIVIACVCVVILLVHILASLKTKKGLLPLIIDLVGLACGVVVLYLIKKKIIKPSADYKYIIEVTKYMLGSYVFALGILVFSYAVKPFFEYIGSTKSSVTEDEKTLIEDAEEELIEDAEEETEDSLVTETEEKEVEEVSDEEINSLKEELAKANQEIDELNKKLEEHIASNVHINVNSRTNASNSFTTDNLTDKSHYETILKTTVTRGFKAKLITADDSIKQTYSDLLNIPFKFKRGNVRHAFAKDTIVLGRTKVAVLKMSPSSKAMYLYINLPASYLEISKYHLKDYSEKTKSLAATPYRLRIKSERSMKYALELLEAAYNELGAEAYKVERPTKDFTEDLGPQTEDQMIENGLVKRKVVEETYLVEPVFAEEEINNEQKTHTLSNKTLENEDSEDEEIDDEDDQNEDSEEE